VKIFRLLLILLIAVLLPVRGVLAAAMVCAPVGGAAQTEVIAHDHSMGHDGKSAEHNSHAHDHTDHAHHPHATDGQPQPPASSSDVPATCNLCCYFCSLTPLVSSLPSLAVPQLPSAASFPDITAPVPSFVSEGQERPPRTI